MGRFVPQVDVSRIEGKLIVIGYMTNYSNHPVTSERNNKLSSGKSVAGGI